MTKKIELPHWESKGTVNRTGDALRNGTLTGGQAEILESWRMAHSGVIHTFEAMLRARAKNQGQDVEVAQRLKRRMTIIDKLHRFESMQLARMDDVAGCRLIFPNIDALHEFRNKVHKAKFKHRLKNEKLKYDYIESPTDRGYRGIHDVYEYRSKSGNTRCDGLLIEIQYRTSLQHAWATAVEVVTQMTENEPKFNRGDPRVIRLFCLASEMLARAHEGRKTRFLELNDQELSKAFAEQNRDIGVMEMLVDLSINEWVGSRMKAEHIILQITKNDREFKLHQYDLELQAQTRLLELEKEFPEDDIVLVGAKTVEEVMSAFRNYFSDVRDFLALMYAAHRKLDPDFAAQEKAKESEEGANESKA